ncbi:MAG: hypothetical protein H7834_07985 [Magnetococcus sp. YQC-9]
MRKLSEWLENLIPNRYAPLLAAFRAGAPGDVVVFRHEWVGYLPDPLNCWVECNGQDVSERFPAWDQETLDRLAQAGVIEKIGDWRNPDDPLEYTWTYKVL